MSSCVARAACGDCWDCGVIATAVLSLAIGCLWESVKLYAMQERRVNKNRSRHFRLAQSRAALGSGLGRDEHLAMFLAMLDDPVGPFVDVLTWLKVALIQRLEKRDILLIRPAQHATDRLQRLIADERDERRVDRIVHHLV